MVNCDGNDITPEVPDTPEQPTEGYQFTFGGSTYTDEEAKESVKNWRTAKISQAITKLFNETAEPDEVVYTLVYSAEETDVVTEYKPLVEEIIDDYRSLFISGAMDPESEADWQTYLTALEKEGLSKWMEAAQSAYDRMNGK